MIDFSTTALPLPKTYTGNYNHGLVFLSFLVAVAASYIALDLTGRIRDLSNSRSTTLIWLAGGSIAMGSGIWAMHFIGMLSFTIPGLQLRYDLFWTILSLLVAIFASWFALNLLHAKNIRLEHYVAGGVILGLAIASMHYTGMEAMLIVLNIRYLPLLFFLSILIAILASEAAIYLALKSNMVITRLRNKVKMCSAVIMGAGICGMHFTGMAASLFYQICTPKLSEDSISSIDPTLMAIGVAGITFVILGIAFFASTYKEALNQQRFEKARQLGMAEISSSVLHNVGNILNSINISVGIIAEKVNKSKLSDLQKLALLFDQHKDELGKFIAEDPKGIKAIEYISAIAKYWQNEQKILSSEIEHLVSNLKLIKDTISTQQTLSKTNEFAEVLSINELLDEAILITDLNNHNYHLTREYGHLPVKKIEKAKLLQIFVNLLRNAKDAVDLSSNPAKNIIVKTFVLDYKIHIEISDNGVGITKSNLKNIYTYGFTTKEAGHGFGLHTSALAINALGGSIDTKSEGAEKGATFIIEIPID